MALDGGDDDAVSHANFAGRLRLFNAGSERRERC